MRSPIKVQDCHWHLCIWLKKMIRATILFTVLAVAFARPKEVDKCPENVQTLPTFDSDKVSWFANF